MFRPLFRLVFRRTSSHVPLVILFAALAFGATPARAAQTHAYVVTTDYTTGGVSSIDLGTRAVAQDVAPANAVYKDARVRWFGGLLYLLNRLGQDNLTILDPANSFAVVHQFSLGNGTNPSDIVVVSPSKAYVSLYKRAHIAMIDPSTGASLGGIDLTPFADADGIPEADHMARFGRWLFVSLQRLDEANGFIPTDSSLVVVIDTDTDTVVDLDPALPGTQAILLSRTNPATPFAWDPVARRFYLGCVGSYGQLDGGIIAIDPETFTDLGVAATEAALGGDLSDVEWHKATHSYAIVFDASFNALLVSWNPASGNKIETLFGPVSGLADCARNDRGELYVCDNSFVNPGVRVFSTTTDQQIAGPLDTGLPPNQVVFDGLSGDVLDAPRSPATVGLSMPQPNPATDRVFFRIALERDAEVCLEAFDLGGRRVRVLTHELMSSGTRELRWDLRDDAGRRVRAGLYLVRINVAGRPSVRRVTVLE